MYLEFTIEKFTIYNCRELNCSNIDVLCVQFYFVKIKNFSFTF